MKTTLTSNNNYNNNNKFNENDKKCLVYFLYESYRKQKIKRINVIEL